MNLSAKLLMNAAYGRFGMDDNFSYIEIVTKDEYGTFEKANIDSIINVIPLGDNYLVQLKYKQNNMNTMLDNGSENHNVNISIAAAISAYARIHMSQFKNNKYNLYYSDTDSIFIDQPLEDSFINSTELGKMKLEGVYNKALFLAPKVYGLKNTASQLEEIIKIKGLNKDAIKKNKIILEYLELLEKDSKLEFEQDKWYKNLDVANILIKNELYTLKATNNKRELIYNNKDILNDTYPYIINNDKIINNEVCFQNQEH